MCGVINTILTNNVKVDETAKKKRVNLKNICAVRIKGKICLRFRLITYY